MGNLPYHRTQPARPFINAGVDLCGPFQIHHKIRGRKPTTCYVAIFCCFATKAVHIEVVSDLTTESFIAALRRFTNRRGNCRHLYCDNATNFVGARNQLKELETSIFSPSAQEKLTSFSTSRGFDFHFIPPRAPHFGGLWEAAVKSAKHLFYRNVTAVSMTLEEMVTVMTDIEAILNSRPLTPLSQDPNDLTALTPGHFLIGEPPTALVDSAATPVRGQLQQRWRLVSQLKFEFWQRWSKEYLCELQHRHKWKRECHNIQPGQLVVIKDDNLPPMQWSMGRVLRTCPGNDGLIRVVELKTRTGIVKRAIHSIAPLPVQTDDSSESTPVDTSQLSKDKINPDSSPTEHELRNSKRSACPDYSASKRSRRTTPLALLMVLALVMPARGQQTATQPAVSHEPFTNQPGLYLESMGLTRLTSTDWNIVVFYNMTSYWTEFRNIENGIQALTQLCEKMPRNLINCRNTVTQIQASLNALKDNNQKMAASTPRNHRQKRAAPLAVVGSLANALFGVLDSDYAEHMTSSSTTSSTCTLF